MQYQLNVSFRVQVEAETAEQALNFVHRFITSENEVGKMDGLDVSVWEVKPPFGTSVGSVVK